MAARRRRANRRDRREHVGRAPAAGHARQARAVLVHARLVCALGEHLHRRERHHRRRRVRARSGDGSAFAYVLLAIPAYAIALTVKAPFLILLSPVGHLLPADSPARVFSFSLFVYVWEDFFGVLMPRLSLFFPWSTAAGYAGIFLTFLLLSERSSRRRRVAIGCTLFMILASMSRLAWVAFFACVVFRGFLALPRSARVVIASLSLACGVAMVIGGVPFDRIGDAARAKFDAARPGASPRRARQSTSRRGSRIRESPSARSRMARRVDDGRDPELDFRRRQRDDGGRQTIRPSPDSFTRAAPSPSRCS